MIALRSEREMNANLGLATDFVSRVFSWIFSKIVLTCYRWFFVDPLRRLYFRGPYLMGYGFWGGKSSREICTRMHDVMSDVWDTRQDLCDAAVEAKFESFLVACEVFLYALTLFAIASFVWTALKTHYANRETERIVVRAVETISEALARGMMRSSAREREEEEEGEGEEERQPSDDGDRPRSPVLTRRRNNRKTRQS